MDILQSEWEHYTRLLANFPGLTDANARANYDLGASVVLRAYLTGQLNKKKAQALLDHLSNHILSKYPVQV